MLINSVYFRILIL